MPLLLLAAAFWIFMHVGVSGTRLRAPLVARLGAVGFRIAYSIGSVLAIILLVNAWQAAPTTPLWFAPPWLRWLLALCMLPAFMLFVGSVAAPNATAVGGEKALALEPRGVFRITRHPMLCAFAIWAAVHVVGNGDTAAIIFFGAFLVTVLAGMPSIDAKLAARDPADWAKLASRSSILPFGAILAGRNSMPSLAELGWLVPGVGALAWVLLLGGHPHIFGVPALLR